jgi:hypothetical protein
MKKKSSKSAEFRYYLKNSFSFPPPPHKEGEGNKGYVAKPQDRSPKFRKIIILLVLLKM